MGDAEGHSVAPTLEAVALRAGGASVAVLAAGAHTAALISEHGRLLDSLELPVSCSIQILISIVQTVGCGSSGGGSSSSSSNSSACWLRCWRRT